MTKHFHITAVLVALALAATSSNGQWHDDQETSAESQIPKSRAPLVVTVDHFFAATTDPERLFRIFRDTFGLPVAWPFRSYGSFASGGLSVGNTALEFATGEVAKGEVLKTEWKMLAFEPAGDTETATAELARRGVAYSKPDVYTFKDPGGKKKSWLDEYRSEWTGSFRRRVHLRLQSSQEGRRHAQKRSRRTCTSARRSVGSSPAESDRGRSDGSEPRAPGVAQADRYARARAGGCFSFRRRPLHSARECIVARYA
ncbi:MAG: hypothetical protein WCE70_09920 [Rhodanobacteraceae bacterium]